MAAKKYKETQWILELAYIMSKNEGPFPKSKLADELKLLHPEAGRTELMNEISYAIELDKHINKRFISVKPGW